MAFRQPRVFEDMITVLKLANTLLKVLIKILDLFKMKIVFKSNITLNVWISFISVNNLLFKTFDLIVKRIRSRYDDDDDDK